MLIPRYSENKTTSPLPPFSYSFLNSIHHLKKVLALSFISQKGQRKTNTEFHTCKYLSKAPFAINSNTIRFG